MHEVCYIIFMNSPDFTNKKAILGVDFGGVISEGTDRDSDTSFFGEHYLDTPATEGSFEALAAINTEGPYAGNVHVVSKCGPEVERRTREWLKNRGFHEETGIPAENLHFTPTRQGKVPIVQALGITAFVDDKPEVLNYVDETGSGLILYAPGEQPPELSEDLPERATIVSNWQQIRDLLNRPE